MKQAIIVRTDLRLSRGKLAAQASHASLGAYKRASFLHKKLWELQGQKKVVLQVSSEQELLSVFEKAKKEKLPCFLVVDAGLTEVKRGTKTAVGIGPAADEKIDKVAGELKLY